MEDEHKILLVMVFMVAAVLLWQIDMIARERTSLKKQAIAHGYAEQVIENDRIVFKWKIPASATAELK